jgi:hypothetical protein
MRRCLLLVIALCSVAFPVASSLMADDKKNQDSDNPTVYIVPGGEVYHGNRHCVTLRRSKTINEISLTEAVKLGLRPCLQCSSPTKEITLDPPIDTTIEKLLAEPGKYDGKRIRVKGVVYERTLAARMVLVLNDDGKKIKVTSPKAVAVKLKDRVAATGIFHKETSEIDATPIVGVIEVDVGKSP